jgi:hypothetical protein
MPRVILASALARWTRPAGESFSPRSESSAELALEVPGANVRELLDGAFAQHPVLRDYVLDEHGAVRHHLALFVDGASLRDKRSLDQPVLAELYVMQALSGG